MRPEISTFFGHRFNWLIIMGLWSKRGALGRMKKGHAPLGFGVLEGSRGCLVTWRDGDVGIDQPLDSRVAGCQGVLRGSAGKWLITWQIHFKIHWNVLQNSAQKCRSPFSSELLRRKFGGCRALARWKARLGVYDDATARTPFSGGARQPLLVRNTNIFSCYRRPISAVVPPSAPARRTSGEPSPSWRREPKPSVP